MSRPQISRIVLPHRPQGPKQSAEVSADMVAVALVRGIAPDAYVEWSSDHTYLWAAYENDGRFSAVLDLPTDYHNRANCLPGKGVWMGTNKPYGVIGRAWHRFGDGFCRTVPHHVRVYRTAPIDVRKLNSEASPFIQLLDEMTEDLNRVQGLGKQNDFGFAPKVAAESVFLLGQLGKLQLSSPEEYKQEFELGVKLAGTFLRLALRDWAVPLVGDVD